jgi:predicted Rossmann fold nucleotide-binding protein DprA/Smf involved in DNA uptake
MTSSQRVLVHLSLLDGLTPSSMCFLANTCIQKNIALIYLYQFACSDFLALGLTQKSAQAVVTGLSRLDVLDSELSLIDRTGARIISIIDSEYPDFLKHIGVPPLVLYIRGNFTGSCARNLAIVGSRHGTAYGRAFIDSVMPELAKQ